MTIGQLEEMPNAEYLQWRAFYLYRQEKERLAQAEANGN